MGFFIHTFCIPYSFHDTGVELILSGCYLIFINYNNSYEVMKYSEIPIRFLMHNDINFKTAILCIIVKKL